MGTYPGDLAKVAGMQWVQKVETKGKKEREEERTKNKQTKKEQTKNKLSFSLCIVSICAEVIKYPML